MMAKGPTGQSLLEPIVLGCYTLTETGLTVTGRPTLAEHQAAGDFITRAHKAAGWWVADWLRYGESRTDWREKLDQVVDAGLMSEKAAKNLKYLGENVTAPHRRMDVDISSHFEVAPLPPKEQDAWLERAATEGWSRQELRSEIRASKRRRVMEGQAVLEGMYRVIYADPPWLYNDSGPTVDGSLGKAARHYQGMTIKELCQLPVSSHALPNSVLFLWTTAPFLLLDPGPRDVIAAWGFIYKANFVWDKVLGMPGHYNHVRHEHLLVCTRGDGQADVPLPLPTSIIVERRTDVHSEKPAVVRKMIERLYTRGPYLELFGRTRVPGWDVFGNDARLWAEDAQASA